MTLTKVRQNPAAAKKAPPGEVCPVHGWYAPEFTAAGLRRQATSGGVPVDRARQMLAAAERIRRNCPECPGLAPTVQEWATSVRLRVRQQ
ncbi:hypothetical protein ABGB07_43955 [Micromonosporaceae bacterium B7E4]